MGTKLSDTGKCLCGAVEIIAPTMAQDFGACHCDMCRTWSAGPFMTVDCGHDVSFKGEENIQVYNSSDWAERGFCKLCGTNLFYRLKSANQYFVSIGIMSKSDQLRFDHQVYYDHKPDNYEFKNDTQTMTEAEIIAMYSPSNDS